MIFKSRVGMKDLLSRVYQSKTGLWFPEFDLLLPRHKNILAVLGTPMGKRLIPASNIVTDAGDAFYAECVRQAAGGGASPTNAFTKHYLATAGTPGKTATFGSFTTVPATGKVNSAGYPKTADGDADNTGAGADIVTHLASYTKADFTQAGITHGLITIAAPVSGSAILTGYSFGGSFDKTADDTLKVFVNHEFLGV